MAALPDRIHGALDHPAILARLRDIRALGRELGDVGAGREGLVPRAAQHDAAHRIVPIELQHAIAELLPHRARQRVEAFGIRERDRCDLVRARRQNRTVASHCGSLHAETRVLNELAVLRDLGPHERLELIGTRLA